MSVAGALYHGTVVHVRKRPAGHRLAYRVFMLALDVDRLGEIAAASRLLGYNRTSLFTIRDRDHGPGDGTPIAVAARAALAAAGLSEAGHRIVMLAMPRVAGYVFNPLTVYYGWRADGTLGAVIYEVNNTFGERHSYVIAAGDPRAGTYAQACEKALYVSPFTGRTLRYGFRVTEPSSAVTVGVQLYDGAGGLMRTHFAGRHEVLTSLSLARAFATYPLLSLKVIAGIHWEALRLYLKGVPLFRHHPGPRYTVGAVASQKSSDHAKRATG